MQRRMWIRSGIIEELDVKQERLLVHIEEVIQSFYGQSLERRGLHPLTVSRLMRLSKRSGSSVTAALRLLANSIPEKTTERPRIYYDRIRSEKNASHRPYRIFLRPPNREEETG